jgi:benzil reductase ((S)-benzoin forming)
MERLIIVTGASSGIGAGLVAAAGDATVASVSRRAAPGHHLSVDLSDPGSWDGLGTWMAGLITDRAWDWVGLVHCAATIIPVGFAGEVDPEAYAANVILNSAAPQVIGELFLAAMADVTARGVLCQISSGAGSKPYPGWSGYSAGKAAVDHWCRTVGIEQAQRGDRIKVISLAPGVVDTDMQTAARSAPSDRFPNVERFKMLHAEGRLQDPADVGRRIWDLLVDADFPNGSVLDLREL